jgi:hypothetical protein
LCATQDNEIIHGPEGPLPRTWREAVPYLVWVVLILGFGLECVAHLLKFEWLQALLAFIGMVGLAAMMLHWTQIRGKFNDTRWLVAAAMLLLLALILSPFVEEERWPLSGWFPVVPSGAEITKAVQKAVEPLKADLASVKKERDAAQARALELEKAALAPLSPSPLSGVGSSPPGQQKSLGQLAEELCPNGACSINPLVAPQSPSSLFASEKERELQSKLDSKDRELGTVTKERDAALAEAKKLREAPSQSGPIVWNFNGQFLIVTGGGPSSLINSVLLQGTSTKSISIKQAYAVSGLTGHRQDLMANVQSKGAYYPVDKVDIPAKAPVWLELLFKPPLSIKEFEDNWRFFHLTIVYSDGSIYEHDYDEEFVRKQMQRQMPTAFGPHVSPRDDK